MSRSGEWYKIDLRKDAIEQFTLEEDIVEVSMDSLSHTLIPLHDIPSRPIR